MIAFLQSFGIQAPGGGSRILRALLDTEHPQALSMNTGPSAPRPLHTKEIHIPIRPDFGRIERTRFHPWFGILDRLFRPSFEKQLRRAFEENQVKLVHLIPHAYEIVPVTRVAASLNIPFFLSVHDPLEYTSRAHPLMREMTDYLGKAWRSARGIFAISSELAIEYGRRFGPREYSLITDGLAQIAAAPQGRPANSLRVYFMGLFHLSYGDNFRALLDALKVIRDSGTNWEISLTCRCGSVPIPLRPDDVPVKVLPFAPEREIENDLVSADLLYLPLPFQEFALSMSRFSLSTKMITYLGSGLPVFYHGPQDSAAHTLLSARHAATVCTTLDSHAIARELLNATANRDTIATNALNLARSQFRLSDQQERFWAPINEALSQDAQG